MEKYIIILNALKYFLSNKGLNIIISKSPSNMGPIELNFNYSENELKEVREIISKIKLENISIEIDLPTINMDGTPYKGIIICFQKVN